MLLSSDVVKVKQQQEGLKYNAILYPDGVNMDEDRAIMALIKSKVELESFYKNYNSNSCNSELEISSSGWIYINPNCSF